MSKKTPVVPTDIDTSRRIIGVAFMTSERGGLATLSADVDVERALGNYVDEADSDDVDEDDAWGGVISSLRSTVVSLMVASYHGVCKFSHCEVSFFMSPSGRARHGQDSMIACSVRRGSSVKIVARKFNDRYTYVYLTTTDEEMNNIVRFLFAQRRRRYDLHGARSIFTWPASPRVTQRWYCSALTFCALKFIFCPVLQQHRCECIEIDELYTLVTRSSRVNRSSYNATPFQTDQLYADGDNPDELFETVLSTPAPKATTASVPRRDTGAHVRPTASATSVATRQRAGLLFDELSDADD